MSFIFRYWPAKASADHGVMASASAQVYTPEALEDGLESAAASFVESEDLPSSAVLQMILNV